MRFDLSQSGLKSVITAGIFSLVAIGVLLNWAVPVSAQNSAPAKPDTPTLRALHQGMVEVDWNDVSGANRYEVQFYTSSGWIDLPDAGLGIEIFFDGSRAVATGLPEDLGYDAFHVRAGNSVGWSEWSEYAWQMTTHNMDWEGIPVPTIEPTPEPVNTPATGAPTISGTAQVGETLTAETSGIADADGLTNVSYSYQWIRNDGTSDIDITGATDSSYTLVAADEGQTIKVKVSFTDDADNDETLISAATGEVDALPNSAATGAPTISGKAQVGETLTADTSGIADLDGLTNVSYGYQWIANDGTSDTDITDATDSSYTLVAADEGQTIKVKVSFTDDADNDETLTSAATGEVVARPNGPATGAPNITGTAQVGETLTASTSDIADPDGLTNVSYGYQWIANDGTSDTDIMGATDSSYVLVAADDGKTIKVRVSFADDEGNDESLTSAATATVAAVPNSSATGAPAVTGTAEVGETLTGSTSGIADADGLTNVIYSYQWIRNDGSSDTHITGATDSSHTLVDADEGKTIKVKVSFTDDRNNKETLTSEATAAVAATVPGAPQNVQISLSVSHALDVSWEAPASNGGSFVTGYKLQWKSGEDNYNASREATKYGHRPQMYRISGLRRGVLYTIRVIAMNNVGEGLPSAEVSDSPLSDLDRLHRFIATDVVEAHESSHPWLRTTWDYMKSGFDLKVSNQPASAGTVQHGCSYYEDGLQKCRAESMKIGPQSVNSLGVLLHEMAHVFTFTNGLLDEPAPLASAHLYFYRLDIAEPLGAACRPGELLADILQLSVVGVSADQGTLDSIAGYWEICNGDYEAGEVDPLTEEALTVVRSALSGQMPQWFADTYHDSNGSVDLEQLWSDIKSIPREPLLLAFSLRQQFGGYCGNPQVARDLEILRSSERVSDNEIRNPWRDGGCVPEAPGGLRIVPGNNQLELSWEAPVDDGGSSIRGYVVEWKSGDEDYDESRRTVVDNPSSHSHTVTGLTEGVEHTLRVTAFNAFGDGDYAAVTNLNSPATGAPPIGGTARVGETLTASTSGIADEDGLSNPTYSYQWIRNDGTTASLIQDAMSSTYTLTDDDAGKTIKVRVSFTDDRDNEETLTSDATAVVAATVAGVPEHVRVTPHDSQALDVSWEAPASDGGSAVTGYKVQWKKAIDSWDTPEDVSEAVVTGINHTIPDLTGGTAYSVRVLTSNEVGDGSASAELAGTPRDITPPSLSTATVNEAVMTLTYDEALDENSVPASETFSVTAEDAATTVASVSVSGSSVTLTLSSAVTTDVAVTVSYAVPAGQTAARIKDSAGNAAPALSSQAVVNVTEQSGNDNSALWSATMTVGVSNGRYGYGSFYSNLGALSDRTITLDGSVYTLWLLSYYSDGSSLVVFLDRALSSGFLLRLDGFEFASDDASTSNGYVVYVYSWPKGQLSWSLGDQVQVSVVQVETSQQPEPAENTPATGLPTISGTVQAGQTLTADTTGISDADGLTNATYSYQWLADDADIAGETASTYTLVTADVGKAIKVRVTFTDDADNEETLTSAATGAVDARPNTPATGLPAISGTVQVGQTLTADVSGISDTDGLDNVSYRYQWVRDDGSTDTDIQDATGSTHTLVDADEGQTIKVKVRFTDDADNEETLTSTATAEVAAGTPTDPPGKPRNLTGTANADGTVTLSWDAPNDDTVTGYQILRRRPSEGEKTLLVHVNDTGSTATQHTDRDVTPDVGHAYRVKAINAVGLSRRSNFVNVTPVQPAEPAQNSPATGRPTISGTAQVGETLTANTSGIADDDGLINVSYSHQWIRNDGTSDTDITDATRSSYTLADADEGQTLKVRVSFTDDVGNDETLTSAATGEVEALPNRPATGAPSISGTAQVGETLTADTSGIADADGLTNVSYSYQWVAGGTDLGGATGSTYTVTASEQGETIQVRVSFTDDAGNQESLTSAATEAVAAKPNTSATGLPTIGGTAQVGETLTADTTGIADADGLTNVSYSYQWVANDGTSDADIGGATGSTYTLTASEQGQTIKVRVSFTDDAGNETTLTSAATEAVAAKPNTSATGRPTISGPARVGETLTVDTSGIADADGLENATFSYQWVGNDGSADTDITGATDTSYTLVADDVGQTIKVRVSFSDDAGNETTLTSAATEAVAARPNTSATGRPSISGPARVGETLTVDTSGIADDDGLTNVSYGYQWVAGGTDLGGATGSTYTLTASEQGKTIKVRVSFTDDAGNQESLTSAATDEVAVRPNTSATGLPTISGTARVGETLTVDTSGIADGLTNVSYRYQWVVTDRGAYFDISGETGASYTLVAADRGLYIQVRVSFTDDAGKRETLTSALTDVVAAAP